MPIASCCFVLAACVAMMMHKALIIALAALGLLQIGDCASGQRNPGLRWAFMGGSTGANQGPTYGVKGTPSPSNWPGGRTRGGITFATATTTGANGALFLFGGNGYGTDLSSTFVMNDLWSYSLTTLQWTWFARSLSAHLDESSFAGWLAARRCSSATTASAACQQRPTARRR